MHIVVGLVLAFVILALVARTRKTTRNCRWRAERSGDVGDQHFYRCAFCGATVLVDGDAPPNLCARPPSER